MGDSVLDAHKVGEASLVLIGGSASVGKTRLALTLARRLAVSIVHLDDLRASSGEPNPFADPTVWDAPADLHFELLRRDIALRQALLVERLCDFERDGVGLVVEGEGIEPRFVAALAADRRVRSVFVIERDAAVLHSTFATRPSGDRFQALRPSRQQAVVRLAQRYGEWLAAEAELHGLPRVASRPWVTLEDRVLALFTGRAGSPPRR